MQALTTPTKVQNLTAGTLVRIGRNTWEVSSLRESAGWITIHWTNGSKSAPMHPHTELSVQPA